MNKKELQKKLQMAAVETIDICEKGYYNIDSGVIYNIEDDIDDSSANQIFYSKDFSFHDNKEVNLDFNPSNKKTIISVVDATTAEAAKSLLNECVRVCILNFASARNPGGGWTSGAVAQEEDLARASTLVHSLVLEPRFYLDNKTCKDSMYTDGMIYTPNVVFFRNSNLDLVEPFHLSVVTCPAPNVSNLTVREEVVNATFMRRITKILICMALHKHKDIVLGAWGCGVFGNNPYTVARAFKKVLSNFNCFSSVTFAIPDIKGINYQAFDEIFKSNG